MSVRPVKQVIHPKPTLEGAGVRHVTARGAHLIDGDNVDDAAVKVKPGATGGTEFDEHHQQDQHRGGEEESEIEVEIHRALALRKLNLDTTAALIRYAIRNGLVGG